MPATQPADVSRYTYRVTWSAENAEFVATCPKFPSLSWLAPSQMDALTGLEDLINEVIADMREHEEAVPHLCPNAATQASSTCASANRYTDASPSKQPKNTSASTNSSSTASPPRTHPPMLLSAATST